MRESEISMIQLEPMRVARMIAYGEHPETLAWDKLTGWARPRGLLDGPEKPRFFGFDNPGPSIGSRAYGYEVWMTVGPEVEPDVEIGIGISEIPGGQYAVARVQDGENIASAWKKLVAWVRKSPYRPSHRQWLEEVLNFPGLPQDALILDLYLPVRI